MHFSRLIKSLSRNGVSATLRIGTLAVQHVDLWLTYFKSRTHDLLDGMKGNGLKGELVDFVWVEFTFSLDSVDLVTDLSPKVTLMKCKTYSSSTLDVRSAILPCNDVAYMHNLVIISLCRNPDGFLWAGDTAQTISIGSTFSFTQLGAFVYRYQVCAFVLSYDKLTVSSEINPINAWDPKSPQEFSVARELSFSCWHC